MIGNKNKLLQVFTQCKLNDCFINFNEINVPKIYKEFTDKEDIHKFKKDIDFLCFKTSYIHKKSEELEKNLKAIATIFMIKPFLNPQLNDTIYEIFGCVEKLLFPLDYTYFWREIEGMEKFSSLLVIKNTRETDIL